MRRSIITLTTLALAGWLAPAAGAHVTLQPEEAPAGGYAVLDVRVPNEKDDARTTKVRVQFPTGVLYAATQPVPGWTAKVVKRKLDQPRKVEGVDVDEEVGEVTFTATGRGVRPGEFQDFPVSMQVPDGKPGAKVTFKALQTYSDGDVVRWIGKPDADYPAPQVTLLGAAGEADDAHGAAGGSTGTTAVAATSAASGGGAEDDGGSDTLAIVALVVGALGAVLGAAGLGAARRARRA